MNLALRKSQVSLTFLLLLELLQYNNFINKFISKDGEKYCNFRCLMEILGGFSGSL